MKISDSRLASARPCPTTPSSNPTSQLSAVPTAALIGVLVRFSIAQYRASRLYLGTRPPSMSLIEPDDSIAGDSRD